MLEEQESPRSKLRCWQRDFNRRRNAGSMRWPSAASTSCRSPAWFWVARIGKLAMHASELTKQHWDRSWLNSVSPHRSTNRSTPARVGVMRKEILGKILAIQNLRDQLATLSLARTSSPRRGSRSRSFGANVNATDVPLARLLSIAPLARDLALHSSGGITNHRGADRVGAREVILRDLLVLLNTTSLPAHLGRGCESCALFLR